jgi:inosose dehydratase
MLAAGMGVPHVITTEGHPQTDWAKSLSFDEQVLVVAEKLYEPVRLAADMGVKVLLEPHGPLTDTKEGLRALMDALGSPDSLKINLDTGNSWLGGSDPVELAEEFKEDIYHIHWKDLPAEMEPQRGTMWGTGMGLIPLGTGAIDVAGVYDVLKDAPHVEYTTLEVAGDDAMQESYAYLKSLGAE